MLHSLLGHDENRGVVMIDHARLWPSTGVPIFPAKPDKRPYTANGFKDATTDPTVIEEWWARWPNANIAIPTGAASGLVVLDVDVDDNGNEVGADSLRELERGHAELPPTASVKTPRGGGHYWFIWPGFEIAPSVEKIGAKLDVRGDGSYVLVPPSRTVDGVYVRDSDSEPAPMPAWLIDLTRKPADDEPRERTPASVWLEMFENGISHSRNPNLTRFGGHLLSHYVDVDVVAMVLHSLNLTHCKPPKPADEVDRIIDSIAGREAQRRRKKHQ